LTEEYEMDGKTIAILVHSDTVLMKSLEPPIKDLRISTASCKTCGDLATLLDELQPHLVLTETLVADGNWLDVVKLVNKMWPCANVLVIGSEPDSRLERVVRDCGGYAYLSPPYEWFPFQVSVRLALRDVKERREELARGGAA
jgi:DNA-binding NtrC family response regulator